MYRTLSFLSLSFSLLSLSLEELPLLHPQTLNWPTKISVCLSHAGELARSLSPSPPGVVREAGVVSKGRSSTRNAAG